TLRPDMRTRFAAALLAFGLVVAPTPASAQKPASPLKVFCFIAPNESGFVDKSSEGRADSLKDLKESIAKKKDWLVLVEAASLAEVTVEVLDRKVVPNGSTAATFKTSKDSKGKVTTTRTESR